MTTESDIPYVSFDDLARLDNKCLYIVKEDWFKAQLVAASKAPAKKPGVLEWITSSSSSSSRVFRRSPIRVFLVSSTRDQVTCMTFGVVDSRRVVCAARMADGRAEIGYHTDDHDQSASSPMSGLFKHTEYWLRADRLPTEWLITERVDAQIARQSTRERNAVQSARIYAVHGKELDAFGRLLRDTIFTEKVDCVKDESSQKKIYTVYFKTADLMQRCREDSATSSRVESREPSGAAMEEVKSGTAGPGAQQQQQRLVGGMNAFLQVAVQYFGEFSENPMTVTPPGRDAGNSGDEIRVSWTGV